MIVINTISETKFSYNGINYFKNFTPVTVGSNKLRILNAYDSTIELTSEPTIFSDFEVDGNTFASLALLQDALLSVIYSRVSLANASDLISTDTPNSLTTGGDGLLFVPEVSGEVITTNTNITSSSLTTQDVAGFVAYINALVSSFSVAANEIRTYTVTDTGQKFQILLRGRSFGGSEPDILTSDVFLINDIDLISMFKTVYRHQNNTIGFQNIGDNALSTTGTATNANINLLGSTKVTSAAAAGSSAVIFNSASVRLQFDKGFYFYQRIKSSDASPIADVRFNYGLCNSGGGVGNVEPSTAAGRPLICMGADSTDTNCQIILKNTVTAAVKVDLGANFPRAANHDYIIEIFRIPGTLSTIHYRVKNLTNLAVAAGKTSFTQNNVSALTFTSGRNNNTTALACAFDIVECKLYIEN